MSRLALFLSALLAFPAAAQTTDLVSLLGPSSRGSGLLHARLTDNSGQGTDVLVVRGQFRGLVADYVSSELRIGDALALTLTAGLAEDNRFGGWGAAENTFTISDELTAALLAGQVGVVVSTADAPVSNLVGMLSPLDVVIDGSAAESAYETVATKQNANMGFGPDIDVTATRVAVDEVAGVAAIAVTGRLNAGSADGIGLFVGSGAAGAAPPGTSLGGTPDAGHFLGAAEHPNFKADFPVSLAFALNPGGGAESAFLDVVRYAAPMMGRRADFLGSAPQDGRLAVGPPDPTANDGTSAPPLADALFAFRNDAAEASGLELLLPLADLGLAPGGVLTLSAFVVSATAFFSDVTVPGTIAGGNPGFDPDFAALAGGPFSASTRGTVALAPGASGAAVLRLVGPNPTAGRTRLVLTLGAPEALRADLVDALGRTVAVLHDGPAPAGDVVLTAGAARLPAGVYVVRVAGETTRAAQRITVVR